MAGKTPAVSLLVHTTVLLQHMHHQINLRTGKEVRMHYRVKR